MTVTLDGLQEKIFIDRYALKNPDTSAIKIGDTVMALLAEGEHAHTQHKAVGEVAAINGDSLELTLRDGTTATVDRNAVTLAVETHPEQLWDRLATALSAVEETDEKRQLWRDKFRDMLDDWKLVPAGRIAAGAGASDELTLFNCFSGDTIVQTRSGPRPIVELSGNVDVLSQGGVYRKAFFKSYGEQSLFEVTLENGETIKTTAGHEWVVTREHGGTERVTTASLEGRRIPIVSNRQPRDYAEVKKGIQHGIVYGDGSASGRYCHLLLFGEKTDFVKYFEGDYHIKPHYNGDYVGVYGLSPSLKHVPPSNATPSYWYGFVIGLLATDGFTDKRGSCGIHSANLFELTEISKHLYKTGLVAASIRMTRKLSPYNDSYSPVYKLQFVKNCMELDDFLKDSHFTNFFNAPKTRDGASIKVVKVVALGDVETVYCCDEPETHTFVIGTGYLTGNCYVIPSPHDSRGGIMTTLSEMTEIMSRGGGVGINLSSLRPKRAIVRGVNGSSSGSVSWGGIFSYATGLIEQGGSRRGALMLMINDWHPDTLDFITAKQTSGSITNANMSVCVSNAFMEAVKADADWTFKFPDTSHPSYDGQWDGDLRKWTAAGYPVIDYKTVKAADVWTLITESAWKSAEPGVVFMERYNDVSNSWYFNPIICTNPCFTGDMRLLTEDGYQRFDELDGQNVNVVNKDGRITSGKVWCSGEKPVVEIRTSTKQMITATPDHVFMVNDGTEVQAHNLHGKRLMPFLAEPVNFDADYVLYGFAQGDGNLTRLNSTSHRGVEINVGKYDGQIRELFSRKFSITESDRKIYVTGLSDILRDLGFQPNVLPERGFPTTYAAWTIEQKRGFIRGCYSANGCVINTGRVSYKTTCREFADSLVSTLSNDFAISAYITTNKSHANEFSNGTYICKESYDVNIQTFNGRCAFFNTIGFAIAAKVDKLRRRLIEMAPIVTSIKPLPGVIPVYDFSEPDTHWGVVEGVVVHNCGEQGLPAWGVCNLSAINLSKFVGVDEITGDYTVMWDSLADTVHTATRFLDNVIDATPYHFEANRANQKNERRVGLGTMGLAEMLIRLRLRYGSTESLTFIDQLYKFMAVEAYKASIDIAAEKGAFPAWDVEHYTWNSVANCSTFADKIIVDLDDAYFGRYLQTGIRNVTVITQAPTGSTGTMVGTSTGIEPYFAFEYTRSSRLGVDKQFVPIAQEWLAANPGQPLPDWFATSMTLTAEDHVRVQAAIQRWVDSSISKTANAAHDFTVADTKRLYELAFDLGCKGVTIYRDGSRDVQVLSTKPDESPVDKPLLPKITKRPAVLSGVTIKTPTPFGKAYVTINKNDSGDIDEVFVKLGKTGADISVIADGIAIALTGVLSPRITALTPAERLAWIIKKFRGMSGATSSGFGANRVESLPDSIAKVLVGYVDDGVGTVVHDTTSGMETPSTPPADICTSCGSATLVREEGCYNCKSCGYTKCA